MILDELVDFVKLDAKYANTNASTRDNFVQYSGLDPKTKGCATLSGNDNGRNLFCNKIILLSYIFTVPVIS